MGIVARVNSNDSHKNLNIHVRTKLSTYLFIYVFDSLGSFGKARSFKVVQVQKE